MDLPTFRQLLTPIGQQVLEVAMAMEPREERFLSLFNALSKQFPTELARAALEVAILRVKAASKFPFADKMYFTREALEQASPFEVSSYRAQRFQGFDNLADLGCSIGGDTISLARQAPTVGIDLEPLRLAMAQANLNALELADRTAFVQVDLEQPLGLDSSGSLGLFFDPARREEGRRIFHVAQYQPPLDTLLTWQERVPGMGVKISPGVDLEELAHYLAEIEFISLNGELKEATLWFGSLRHGIRRATILPGPFTLSSDSLIQPDTSITTPQEYLYEPDPAVIRSGLVRQLGEQLGAAQLDESIAYLTASQRVETSFARSWQIEYWLPFQLKRLRASLRERGVGRVVVKKRGSPITPEALIHDLRLQGDQERIVFLTQSAGKPVAIVCFP